MSDKKDKLEGKFVAQCMNGKQQMAMSNRGHLLPCCWCDQEWTLNTPLFQKMLKVSKVSEAENVDEIVLSDEWRDFEKIMKEGEAGDHSRVPRNCLYHCLVREDDHIKIEHHLDEKGKSIVKNKT